MAAESCRRGVRPVRDKLNVLETSTIRFFGVRNVFLFELASRHMTWLAQRQSVTAGNVANADTPGYRAQDIQPFESVLASTAPSLTVTQPGHLAFTASVAEPSDRKPGDTWGTSHSGNSVSLESELMKAGESARLMSVDANLTRSFQRMLLTSIKV
jgi:flagellar basal-body rod protein FlgB